MQRRALCGDPAGEMQESVMRRSGRRDAEGERYAGIRQERCRGERYAEIRQERCREERYAGIQYMG